MYRNLRIRVLGYQASIAKNNDPISDSRDLVQSMANVNKANPLPSELVNLAEESLCFSATKRRSRLIQNEKLGIAGESLCDFYQLLGRNAKRTNQSTWGQVQAKPAKLLSCSPIHLVSIDKKSFPWQVAHENVFGDAEIGQEAQFLVNKADTRV